MKSYSAKIVSLVLLMTMFTACSNSAVVTETAEESTTVFSEATEIAETAAVETTEETTVETNVIDNFTVETLQYSAGVEYSRDVACDIFDVYTNDCEYNLFDFGFDNYILQQNIIDYVENETGVRDESLTAANFHSFQYGVAGAYPCSLDRVGEYYSENGILIRTILSRLGLRFMIDEVPAWFIEENWPLLYKWYSEYDDENANNIENYIAANCQGAADIPYSELYTYNPEALSIYIFYEIIDYNGVRSSLTRNYYAGDEEDFTDDVRQERNENTGRFVLIPTEEQYFRMVTDIQSNPTYENMDLIHPETEEELSELLGVNTLEAIPYDLFTYESQTFSYVDGQVVRTLN